MRPIHIHTIRTSRHAIFALISSDGPISKHKISQKTGLSRPTVIEALNSLLESDMVSYLEEKEARQRGRIPRLYYLNPSYQFGLGVDIGGSKILAGLTDLNGKIVAEIAEKTESSGGVNLIDQITSLRDRLVQIAGIESARVSYGVIGMPGVPQSDGSVKFAENVEAIDNFNFKTALSNKLNVPLSLENDVNLGAVAELENLSENENGTIALVSIGTGIGMGLIIDRQLFKGAFGRAGEIGFVPIGSEPYTKKSHSQGFAESKLSGIGLQKLYSESGTNENLTGQEIFERYFIDEPTAVAVVEDYCGELARLLVTISVIIDPSVIILTGGIGSNEHIMTPLSKVFDSMNIFDVEIRQSQLKNRSGLLGALSLSRNFLAESLHRVPVYDPLVLDDPPVGVSGT